MKNFERRQWLTLEENRELDDNKLQCSGCGSDMLFFTIIETGYGNIKYHVTCSSCEARGGKAGNKTQAINEWNRQGE